jgi:hypothetical protein
LILITLQNFNRDFLEDEPLSAELLSVDGKTQYVESDDSGDDEPAADPSSPVAPTNIEQSKSPSTSLPQPPPTSVATSSASGLEILKGNRDGIILAVIFGGTPFPSP